jgi:outer membrane receptor for ferric coprogen and ferric-rhodotorulic acid
VDRERIDDFQLNTVNELLDQVVGINVERVETDRTYFNARGFDITNFQVDGIGLPLLWGIQFGDLDTALFDRVEAVRGANAIMSGVGNPSATINYVRKRPLDTLHASASAEVGSWDRWRLEGDVSVPFTDTLGARLVYAHEERDSYLDFNHVNRDVAGAIVSWKITPELTATVGYSRQDNDADGVLWGALPLTYTDGSRIDFPVSASTSADWTYWNVTDQTAFAELGYAFGGGWQAKGVFTYSRFKENAKLLYAYGYPDRETGLGVGGMTGIYPSIYNRYLGDFYASGPVTAFGREHELAFGVSTGRSDAREWEDFYLGDIAYPDVRDWGEVQVAEPEYPGAYLAADYSDRLTRAYGAAHLNLADNLKAVVGASAMWLKSTGVSYLVDQSRDDSKISPYVGAVFDVTKNVSLYASYTDIFNPQVEVGIDNRKLDPAHGSSLEGGIKSEWFDGRLYATASLFRSRQKGLASAIGTFGDPDGPCPEGPAGDTCYAGVDTTSKGFEIEIAGRITDNWTLSGGYTGLDIEDQDGNDTRTWLPTKTFKLATTYTVPEFNDLKLGAQLRWQNTITYADPYVQDYGLVAGDVILEQGDYAVLDLMASVRVADHVRAGVNVRNVTDSKYLASLMWGQAFYAAPRSASVSLSFEY